MNEYRGIIIHPEELEESWIERIVEGKINVLGIHPVGGKEAAATLEKTLYFHLLPQTQNIFKKLNHFGVQVEYEAHAMGWLLPRNLYELVPHWFRMDENGYRVNDYNLCPSCMEALDFVSQRAEYLSRMLETGSDRYFFWMDDVAGKKCHCEKCRHLSASDQALMTINAMLKGIRMYKPTAKLCYLAYMDTLEVPQHVEPSKGVFLEYAPIHRDFHVPLFQKDNERNKNEVRSLQKLMDLFGREDAQVLEYWMDNSLYSNWTKPPKQFVLDEKTMSEDVKAYRALGFNAITSFGCYLGKNYRELWGEPPIVQYGEILRNL